MGKRLIIKGASFITNAIDRITPSTTYYSVTYNLSHCTASNSATSIAAGSTYTVTITPQSGYSISNVVVRHNGATVMPTGSGYTYRINSVAGNITVTATATADEPIVTTYTVTYNLSNVTSSNNATTVEAGSSYTVTLTPLSGYEISSASVTHNGQSVSPTSGYTYNIPSVSGNIVISATAIQEQGTTYSVTYNLTNVTSSNNTTTVEAGSSYSFTLSPITDYEISSVTVTHNGVEIQPTSGYTYSIAEVNGNIVVEGVAVTTTYLTEDDLIGHSKGYINTDGTWKSSTSWYGDFIALTNDLRGGTASISASASSFTRISFVKSLPSGSKVTFATGWGVGAENGVLKDIPKGSSRTFTVPSDAAYLYVYLYSNGTTIPFPQEIAVEHT